MRRVTFIQNKIKKKYFETIYISITQIGKFQHDRIIIGIRIIFKIHTHVYLNHENVQTCQYLVVEFWHDYKTSSTVTTYINKVKIIKNIILYVHTHMQANLIL